MLEAIGLFVLGLVLLALGGDSIVKGASGLAQRFGASPFVAGLALVAFGTSLPELAVNLQAVVRGEQSLALGNAVGSNIVNFGLTLGIAAFAAPLLVRWRSLAPLLLVLILGTAAVIALGLDGVLSRAEGAGMVVVFFAVVAYAMARTRREAPELQDAIAAFARTRTDLGLNLLRFAIAAVLLYFGSKFVVGAAPRLGASLGLTPLLTGLLPVAIGTALPEAAAAIAAARRGQGDIVVGHVIGSSLFNLLIVVGGMAAWNAVALPASFVRFELPAAIAFALMLYPMLRGDLRVSKGEGAVLLIALLAWIGFELAMLYR
ncbi:MULTISPECIES: sodium:calcium antiporter [unclassified Lysobacter]|uniref:sodium:calcium antiporter n=1 Tax=unclassified Lysobacter TaxID=2635362 RepID=UPI00070E87A4|nr:MULTISPECIES: sodium:calcium antiporter [unclassified Lysobacter]KRD33998.1 calcium:sodium antiporter [Lysobacter sp. Root916]KRD77339.1 calcium:sodium antiporter [Lysobacter sp. Root983]